MRRMLLAVVLLLTGDACAHPVPALQIPPQHYVLPRTLRNIDYLCEEDALVLHCVSVRDVRVLLYALKAMP